MPVIDVFSGNCKGNLRVVLAMGRAEQIASLQRTRAEENDSLSHLVRPVHLLDHQPHSQTKVSVRVGCVILTACFVCSCQIFKKMFGKFYHNMFWSCTVKFLLPAFTAVFLSQVIAAHKEAMREHLFMIRVEKINGLTPLQSTVWGEADCYVQYSFPSQEGDPATKMDQNLIESSKAKVSLLNFIRITRQMCLRYSNLPLLFNRCESETVSDNHYSLCA